MTRQEIDTLWFKAMHESIQDGEDFTRYQFAKLVAAIEREACAQRVEVFDKTFSTGGVIAHAIRARGM